MMKLSNRLQAIADYVTPGHILCDVGCDHGYLPIYLVEKGVINKALAMDINEGPLLRAKEHIQSFGLDDKIQTRLSDGVAKLEADEADTVIIAGMGGGLTIHILEDGFEVLKTVSELILEPQSDLWKVRQYVRTHGYQIVDENLVFEDGKYYPIMRLIHGEAESCKDRKRQQVEDYFGPVLLQKKHPVLLQFLRKEATLCDTIQAQILASGGADSNEERLKELDEKRHLIEEALQILQGME